MFLSDQIIGAERVAVSRLDDGALVVNGQAVYVAPTTAKLSYRSTRDALDLTDRCSPHRTCRHAQGDKAVGAQDGRPPLELEAGADAVIAPQTVAEFVWYATMVADLDVGRDRPLAAVEVQAERSLALDPGAFTATRQPDTAGRRIYAITGRNGRLDVKGTFSVDPDGAPHEVSVTLIYGTIVIRRR